MQPRDTTALKKFTRLETIGLWRSAREAQKREVVVSFGEATLVLTDSAGRPLSHWSLPAIARLNPDELPALFSPDADPDDDQAESLELDDALMISALEQVQGAIAQAQPHPGLLRRRSNWLALAAVAAIAVFWMPGALKRQTLALVPEATRVEVGATLLGLLQRETGPACRSVAGTAALERMVTRLYGAGSGITAVVLPQGDDATLPGILALPGGLVALPEAALRATDDPFVLAGDLVAALARNAEQDPLAPVLDQAGFGATLSLLVSGKLSSAAVEPMAQRLLAAPPAVAETDALLDAFGHAGLPITPWARSLDAADDMVTALIEADPLLDQEAVPVMSDADWVGLQGICGA